MQQLLKISMLLSTENNQLKFQTVSQFISFNPWINEHQSIILLATTEINHETGPFTSSSFCTSPTKTVKFVDKLCETDTFIYFFRSSNWNKNIETLLYQPIF